MRSYSKRARWRSVGEQGLPYFKIGGNLFPAQFRRGTLLEESALSVSGLPASVLELEITENIVLGQSDMYPLSSGYATRLLRRIPESPIGNAILRLKIDGSILVVISGVEVDQGSHAKMVWIAAKALN